MNIVQIHEGNRDAWNRTARGVYASGVEADVAFLRAGGVSLMKEELSLLGELRCNCGRAIHLQCSHGLDALSLLNLGVDSVVGVDISEEMLSLAQAKSESLGASARWIRSDVIDTPHDLDGTAALVYTGKGAISWMVDLDVWASVVARLLRPGGRLLLFEGHPLDLLWESEATEFVLREGATYFNDAPVEERGFPYEAALHENPSTPVALNSRNWTLGQVVTSVVNAGLVVERLEEFAEPFWDQFKEIAPQELRRLPHTFGLVARRPR